MPKILALEDKTYKELVDLLKAKKNEIDFDRLKQAYLFAKKAHEGQFRMSGLPYICHPVEATKILAQFEVDEDTLVAGLLHDVPEDTAYGVEDIEKQFGKHVATLVSALTKLSKVYYRHSMDERQVNSLRKMFLETSNDVRVVIIKLADRLHNMQTIQYLRPDKQQRIAKETLEIYAPLANLYGIYQIRRELEDLCFRVLQPEEYGRIMAFVHDNEKKREEYIQEMIRVMKKSVKMGDLKVEFQGRPKHLYSIYQKSVREQKALKDIYDYFAIRIITQNKLDCYQVLGLVHETFKPKGERFKDYIALPKPNGYQSLHTTVVGLRGRLTEIQIRTMEMHKEAEFGAAAHIFYKEGFGHVKTPLAHLKRYTNPELFIRGLQEDLLKDRMNVFSPKGELVNLPEGANCLDYVYAMNLPVKFMFRALVNKKPYSLIGELQNGDIVEIVYNRNKPSEPQRWWLDHVKTAFAKKTIGDYFRKKSFESRVKIGTHLLQQEFDRENKGAIYKLSKYDLKRVTEGMGLKNFDEVLAGVGEGTVLARTVYRRFFPTLEMGFSSYIFEWLRFIRNKLGFSISERKYRIRVLIEAYDRIGLIKELVQPFYDLNIPIIKFVGYGYDLRNERLQFSEFGSKIPMNVNFIGRNIVDMDVESHEQLTSLFDRIEKISGVLNVRRVFKRKQISFVVLAFLIAIYFVLHFVLIQRFSDQSFFSSPLWCNVISFLGLFFLMSLLVWLRSLGNKTFPHFEETKYFWPLSFVLTLFSIAMVFFDRLVYGLEIYMPLLIGVSILAFGFLAVSYRAHLQRSAHHLSQLKSSQRKVFEPSEQI